MAAEVSCSSVLHGHLGYKANKSKKVVYFTKITIDHILNTKYSEKCSILVAVSELYAV